MNCRYTGLYCTCSVYPQRKVVGRSLTLKANSKRFNKLPQQATCFKTRLSFSHLPVRLLLHSTLAAAETLLFAGELLPFGRRQP